MNRLLAIILSGCLLGPGYAAPALASGPELWGGLEPGPYDVGFIVLSPIDPSRSYGQSPCVRCM
jgi:hypothetical protein